MYLGLKDRVAIVTGGTRGIGLATANALAAEGCVVAVCGRNPVELDGLYSYTVDVTKPEELTGFVNAVHERFGRLDILVNNVGGSMGGGGFDASTVEQWQGVFELNVFSTLVASKAAIPHMKAARWGRIVNVASIWGKEGGGGAAYNGAKSAVISMSKAMARDLAADGILVNAVAPGSVLFPGGGWAKRMQADPEKIEKFVQTDMPLGRFGHPEEVANTIVFLSSAAASLITGSCVVADGGQSHSNI
ncbi:MAG: SDR family oxidoreductase [Acidobacteria bacterium]|nr:SDR family oxidoreductase [Acidobacteriota bacterium]